MKLDPNLVLLGMAIIGVLINYGYLKAFFGRRDDSEGPLTKAMKKKEE
jgi:hypothetical protein